MQEHGKGAHYLHKARTGDEGFLMVDAKEEMSRPGCSAERPGKDEPKAMMTAAELLKTAGTAKVMVEGDEDAEWGGQGPDGTPLKKYGYGQLSLGASSNGGGHHRGCRHDNVAGFSGPHHRIGRRNG